MERTRREALQRQRTLVVKPLLLLSELLDAFVRHLLLHALELTDLERRGLAVEDEDEGDEEHFGEWEG